MSGLFGTILRRGYSPTMFKSIASGLHTHAHLAPIGVQILPRFLTGMTGGAYAKSGSSVVSPNQQDHWPEQELEDGRYLRAKFKKCDNAIRESFSRSACLVTLSIGQPLHEGTNLASTLHLVNSTFSSCVFALGDELQAHTRALTERKSIEELRRDANGEGNEWLARLNPLMQKLNIPFSVIRWSHWLNNPRFSELYKKIQQAYESDPSYRQAIENNIDDYLARVRGKLEIIRPEAEARQLCLNYLLEECAAMCLWASLGCQVELYANGRAPAMQATYERFIQVVHPDILIPVALRFDKRPINELGSENKDDEHYHKDVTNAKTCKPF